MIYYLIYILIMSAVTFLLYFIDKKRAENDQYRISEKALLIMSFLGGAIGGYLAMVLFRHKTRHWYFNVINIVSIVIIIAIFITLLFLGF